MRKSPSEYAAKIAKPDATNKYQLDNHLPSTYFNFDNFCNFSIFVAALCTTKFVGGIFLVCRFVVSEIFLDISNNFDNRFCYLEATYGVDRHDS